MQTRTAAAYHAGGGFVLWNRETQWSGGKIGEEPARFPTVSIHLRHQRVQVLEFGFGTKEVVERHLDFLSVKITGKVEKVGFE